MPSPFRSTKNEHLKGWGDLAGFLLCYFDKLYVLAKKT